MGASVLNYQRIEPGHLHDVKENAAKLSILYSVEVELSRLIGGWIPRIPELPEKMTLARILYQDADHARALGERLLELRIPADALPDLRRRTVQALVQLEHCEPSVALAGIFRVVKPSLLADFRRHLDACPPYVDEPTVRILRRIVSEEAEHIEVGLSLLADRGIEWETKLGGVEAGLWDLTADDGRLVGGQFVGHTPIPLNSPEWPAAVVKLPDHEPMPPYPESFDRAMQRCVHDLVFSETEAMDIFGRYVYEFGDEFPWEFSFDAARICWDEARHVELLLNVLDRYGGQVGQFPAKAPGYEEFVREPTTLEKIIMVNVIAEGEVSTDTQTQHREAFRELGDELSALLKDYEMADEVSHGQFGLKWARWLAEHTGEDYEEAHARARKSLEDFKSLHDDEGGDSPIPLVRLGVDETGERRLVNVGAKKLLGYSDEEIERIAADSSGTIEE